MAATPTAQIAVALPEHLYEALHDYAQKEGRNRSEAIRYLLNVGLNAEAARCEEPSRLLLPAPTEPAAVPTLTEIAALIRRCAEENPFVRPLADFLEGRV